MANEFKVAALGAMQKPSRQLVFDCVVESAAPTELVQWILTI